QVPTSDGSIGAGRGKVGAVPTESNGEDRVVMPIEDRDRAPRGHIPDPYAPISPRRGEMDSVRAEGQGVDRSDLTVERADLAARGRVPESDGPLLALGRLELAPW